MSKLSKESVTIIVPVYGDWPSLANCIRSLKLYVDNTRHTVLLVNDCGPDADQIEENIKQAISDFQNFKYYRNPKNLGFVMSCNRAVSKLDKTQNNILLLNSDTEVTEGFLEEMLEVLRSEGVGVVSPRSNNATICTVPLTAMRSHGIDAKRSYSLYMKRHKKLMKYTVAPTAHGFCMLIRRPLIKKYGLFDEIFGKGYGEEVDFCRRILGHGWKSAISNWSYVYHLEARSFSMETKRLLLEKNSKILKIRYPDYKQAVEEYVKLALIEEASVYRDMANFRNWLKLYIKSFTKR